MQTKYHVASAITRSGETVALLSQLKEFSRLEDRRVFTTRDFWAAQLGVNRRTIQRWEDEILAELWFLSASYYADKKRKTLLDNYQRFILSLIYSMKKGIHPFTDEMTNKQILAYMLSPQGSPFWLGITRDRFNEMETNYSRRAG